MVSLLLWQRREAIMMGRMADRVAVVERYRSVFKTNLVAHMPVIPEFQRTSR